MRLEQASDLAPGSGQVVVGIKAAGVNPVDTYIRAGAYANKPSLPYTPGRDAAGVVMVLGQGVTRAAVGERVYLSGTLTGAYAEQALCEEKQVHRLPDRVSFAQGAAVNIPYATAFRALFQLARAVPGETVLVHGATGGVGIAAVQLAHAAGINVIGTGGSEKGRALVAQQGARQVLDHGRPGHFQEIQGLTQGRGVDVILEMVAHLNLDKDLKILAPKGRLVVVGSRGRVEIDPRDIMTREAVVTGLLLFLASEREEASLRAGLFAGLENGTLRPVVGRELPLAEAPEAHRQILEPGAYGKIVLLP